MTVVPRHQTDGQTNERMKAAATTDNICSIGRGTCSANGSGCGNDSEVAITGETAPSSQLERDDHNDDDDDNEEEKLRRLF